MPMGAALAGGAVLGGIAGSQKNVTNMNSRSGIDLAPASALENQANGALSGALSDFTGMVNAGPGQSDVAAGYNSTKDLASLLDSYSKGGYNPTAADISSSNDLAAKLFQGQQTSLNQAFEDQTTAAARQAALMGRDISDPVLRAKLAQEQTRQQAQLSANQGSWATNYALQQPMQRLDFAQQKTNVLSGLATQAMQNRQALMSLGSGIMNDERNFRVQTGTRWGDTSQSSGGGLGGALNGALAGMGAFSSAATGIQGLFSSAKPAAAAAAPAAAAPASNPFGYGLSGSLAASPIFAGGSTRSGIYG